MKNAITNILNKTTVRAGLKVIALRNLMECAQAEQVEESLANQVESAPVEQVEVEQVEDEDDDDIDVIEVVVPYTWKRPPHHTCINADRLAKFEHKCPWFKHRTTEKYCEWFDAGNRDSNYPIEDKVVVVEQVEVEQVEVEDEDDDDEIDRQIEAEINRLGAEMKVVDRYTPLYNEMTEFLAKMGTCDNLQAEILEAAQLLMILECSLAPEDEDEDDDDDDDNPPPPQTPTNWPKAASWALPGNHIRFLHPTRDEAWEKNNHKEWNSGKFEDAVVLEVKEYGGLFVTLEWYIKVQREPGTIRYVTQSEFQYVFRPVADADQAPLSTIFAAVAAVAAVAAEEGQRQQRERKPSDKVKDNLEQERAKNQEQMKEARRGGAKKKAGKTRRR